MPSRMWPCRTSRSIKNRSAWRSTGTAFVDPCNIYDSIREDGYAGLAKVLTEMKPDEVIDIVKKSGLRGRGGAGFPAGLKWEHTKKSGAKIKAVVCNGDEGDPGAFMDRALMEGDPHSVIEGMIINAYRHRRAVRLYLRAARVSPCGEEPGRRHQAGPGAGASRQEHPGLRPRFRHARSRKAPAPLSAANQRRSLPPSKASAACRVPVLRGSPRRQAVSGTCPRT